MSRQDTALGVDLLLLARGVTDFLNEILGKLKVKFHVYMCAVSQTCKSDKKYCMQLEANSGLFPLVCNFHARACAFLLDTMICCIH